MDYTLILRELQSASLFDLYRLRVAISQQLDNPIRIERLRAQLRLGMTIEYFDESENRLVKAKVLELNRTRVVVQNLGDQKRWSIKFCMINLDNVTVDLHPTSPEQPLDKSLLQVGDRVSYLDRQNRDVYGRVESLNPKTATILTTDGHRWRVSYGLLSRVVELSQEDDIIMEEW